MNFGDWQASRGIQPWMTKPQHIAPALNALSKMLFKAADSMKEFGNAMAKFASQVNATKED